MDSKSTTNFRVFVVSLLSKKMSSVKKNDLQPNA